MCIRIMHVYSPRSIFAGVRSIAVASGDFRESSLIAVEDLRESVVDLRESVVDESNTGSILWSPSDCSQMISRH